MALCAVYMQEYLPDGASLKAVGNSDSSVQIFGIHTSRQAIGGVISHINHLVDILELENWLHWTKDLYKRHIIIIIIIIKHIYRAHFRGMPQMRWIQQLHVK